MEKDKKSKLIYIQRYLAIIRFFKKNPGKALSTSQIQAHVIQQFANKDLHEVGTCEETIKRDLREIGTLGYLFEYDRKAKGYILDQEFNDYKIEEVLDSFYILNAMNGDSGKPDYIFSEKRPYSGMEHFIPLKNAIQNRKIVQFDYHKYYPEEKKLRTIEPYALKESRGRWYLLGFEKDKKDKKAFCFDRIIDLKFTGEEFNKQINIHWEKEYEHCFAMFTTEAEPEKVVISLDRRDANYVESKPIHRSQKKIEKEEGDRVFFELNIKITEDLIMELMSRSWSIEIIEPLSLRNRIADLLQKALDRNQKIS